MRGAAAEVVAFRCRPPAEHVPITRRRRIAFFLGCALVAAALRNETQPMDEFSVPSSLPLQPSTMKHTLPSNRTPPVVDDWQASDESWNTKAPRIKPDEQNATDPPATTTAISASDNATSENIAVTRNKSSFELPIASVVLMGQFNYKTPFPRVQRWTQIWSRYFVHIVVAGPFKKEVQEKLREAGIEFIVGRNDAGFVSPYQNLLNTMLAYRHSRADTTPVKAVMYLHDDALLNLTALFNGRQSLPTNTIMKSPFDRQNMPYSIHVQQERRRWPQNGTEFSWIPPSSFRFQHAKWGTTYSSIDEFLSVLPPWPATERCLRQQVTMLSGYDKTWWEAFSDYTNTTTFNIEDDDAGDEVATESRRLLQQSNDDNNDDTNGNATVGDDGTSHEEPHSSDLVSRTAYRFSFAGHCQSDFLYIPLQYTELFQQAVMAHIRGKVYLECAMPTIVDWIVQRSATSAGGRIDPSVPQGQQEGATNDKIDTASFVVLSSVPVASIEEIRLCTDWGTFRGNAVKMIYHCLDIRKDWGMYHPIKMTQIGPSAFSTWLDLIQGPVEAIPPAVSLSNSEN